MIEIRIPDVSMVSKNILRKTATYLLALAGDELVSVNNPTVQIHNQTPKEFECTYDSSSNSITLKQAEEAYGSLREECKKLHERIVETSPILEADVQEHETEVREAIKEVMGTAPTNPFAAAFAEREAQAEPVQTEVPSPPPALHAVTGTLVDSAGYPWDGRIHARTKTKNADGTWKIMRGASMDSVEKIRGELQQSSQVPLPPSDEMPVVSFPDLMKLLLKIRVEKIFTQKEVVGIVNDFGIETVTAIAEHPELIPEIYAEFESRMNEVLEAAV